MTSLARACLTYETPDLFTVYKHNLLYVLTTQNRRLLERSSMIQVGLGSHGLGLDAKPVFFDCYDLFRNIWSSAAFLADEF